MAHKNQQVILGGQLKRIRLNKGISLQTISKHMGVSAMTISRWESGESGMTVKNLDTLLKLIGARLTMGSPDGILIVNSLTDELEQMNTLLTGTTQLLRAMEYRVVLINNLLGRVMTEADLEGWEDIIYNYEYEGLLHQYKEEEQGERKKGR